MLTEKCESKNILKIFFYCFLCTASLLVLGTQLTAFTRAVQPEPTSESPTPGQGHGSPAPRNQSSVCPTLWQRASTSGRQFLGGDSFMTSSSDAPPRGVAPKLCVWVNERRAPWKEALSACRRRNGFLVKLETIIELEGGRGLLEDIRQRGKSWSSVEAMGRQKWVVSVIIRVKTTGRRKRWVQVFEFSPTVSAPFSI